MTKLASTYARSMGLQLDPKGPNVKEAFYPHPFTQYITLQAGSAAEAAKNYDHWDTVVALIKPVLDANRIAILSLGVKEDPIVAGTHDLRAKTTILQANYLIGRTLLHAGGDSFFAHCAGWHYRPLVAVYGTTDPGPHGPYWFDPAKTSLIVSHRWGGKPTYTAQEPVKSVNLVDPHHVANEILRLLGVSHVFPQQTRFQGLLSKAQILDCVPTPNGVPAPAFFPELPLNIRMDWDHNEQVLAEILSTGRRVNLIVNHPIDPGLLQHFKAQILSYTHELGAPASPLPLPALEYIGTIKGLFPRHAFFTREQDAGKVAELRFQYLDHALVEQVKDPSREDYIRETLIYLNREDTPAARVDICRELAQDGGVLTFRTNRFILSSGAIFLSYPHLRLNQSITNLSDNTAAVIDDPLFFRDLNHVTITYTPNSDPVQA